MTPQHTEALNNAMFAAFLHSDAAFLAPLMARLEIVWTRDIQTAAVSPKQLMWNPDFFMKIPPKTRQTVLLHELYHLARLHLLRRGSRDPKIWGYACDIRINNDLTSEGQSFVGVENCWRDPSIDGGPDGVLSEEQIYDVLIAKAKPAPSGHTWDNQGDPDDGDQLPSSEDEETDLQDLIDNFTAAQHAAKLFGNTKSGSNGARQDLSELIRQKLNPTLPWSVVLEQHLTELIQTSARTWARPNRRYPNMYRPSAMKEEGALDLRVFVYIDISGSVSEYQGNLILSELQNLHRIYRPEELHIIQFDDYIQKSQVIQADEEKFFDTLDSGGGTDLVPVKEHIDKHKPSLAIIFSDLWCNPMPPLESKTPVVWVVVDNRSATVPYGRMIHLTS